MTAITFLTLEGTEERVDVPNGQSLMEAAVENGIAGIVGECGGSLLCATCHVYVEGGPVVAAPAKTDVEDDMLDLAQAEVTEKSRLSCQLVVSDAMGGLVVRVPKV